MPRKSSFDDRAIALIQNDLDAGRSVRWVAKRYGTSASTVQRLGRVRKADEFPGVSADGTGAVLHRHGRRSRESYAWSLETIRGARDAQMRGEFERPVSLANAMMCDDAIFTAAQNRIAPQNALASVITGSGVRGEAIANAARTSVSLPRGVLVDIAFTLAFHGNAIGHVISTPNAEGSRVDMRLSEWPLQFVKPNSTGEYFETSIEGSSERVPIRHGDGEWIVFKSYDDRPYIRGAALLALAYVWAAHAEGIKSWAQSADSHGLTRLMGELPPGISLQADKGGGLSPDARAFLELMQSIVSGASPVGIRPSGSKTEFVSDNSTAWQIFSELVLNREKAAARILNGTDAYLGAASDAPGVDISTLFGVSSTIVQRDLQALEDGINTGLLVPWTAVNYGDSRRAPRFAYVTPDVDSEKKSAEDAARLDRLFVALQGYRDNSFEITQDVVARLAATFGVVNVPTMAAVAVRTTSLVLAPTDIAPVVRVDEARASQGMLPLGGADGAMFLSEWKARQEAARGAAPSASPAIAPNASPAAPAPEAV